MELITGYKGVPHITAEDDAHRNAGIIGSEDYITPLKFPNYDELLFECTKVNNNEVKIGVGQVFILGKQVFNDSDESVTIESGGQGVKRADIVGLVYCQDETTGVETVEAVAVKGTAGNEYVDPDYSDASAIAENGLYFAPMYRVKIDELEIVEIERIAKIRSLDSVTLFTSETGISAVDARLDLSHPLSDFKRIVVHYNYFGVAEQSFTIENYTTPFMVRQFNLADNPESEAALNMELAEMYLKKETDTQFKIQSNRNIKFDNDKRRVLPGDSNYDMKIYKIEGYYI